MFKLAFDSTLNRMPEYTKLEYIKVCLNFNVKGR